MKGNFTRKHYGETIEIAIRKSDISITDMAKKLNVSRRAIYNWFNKEYLPADIVYKISQVLNYDFSADFPDLITRPSLPFEMRSDQAEIIYHDQTASFWKNKYLHLLETHYSLLRNIS